MIIRDSKGRVTFGRWELPFQALIVLSLVAFAVDTPPDLSDQWRKGLQTFEVSCVAKTDAALAVVLLRLIIPIAFAGDVLRGDSLRRSSEQLCENFGRNCKIQILAFS